MMQCPVSVVWQRSPPSLHTTQPSRSRTSLKTWAYSTSQPGPAEIDASTSKCPVARIVNGTKDLFKGFQAQAFDYTPFSASNYQGRYKMTMGLEPMNPLDWIEIDDCYEEELALRKDLVKNNRSTVIHSLPGAEEANREMLELLADFLPKRFPDRFSMEGTVLINHSLGDSWDLADKSLDPLEVSAQLVQEDLCLMTVADDGALRFVSGAVLFPQRWSLAEKLGMDMRRIHEPVPLFNKEILKPVNAFMNRITPNKPFWRANWTISDNPELFQPVGEEFIMQANSGQFINDKLWGQTEPVTAENAGKRLQTRCERETLSRFPRTGAILFTIRTHMRKLQEFEGRPDKAKELAHALRNLPQELKNYKTIAAFQDQALEYLDLISSQNEARLPEPALH
ncbi:g2779 [Coccomyxa viridis]|uniref:G2779 protein n=1 Tax=Coccomyxa viridis TaxID=1274662 RepID=A0ABP1FTA9_9CHLO